MKLSRRWFILPLAALALVFAAAGCGGSSKSDSSSGGSGGELVFGTAADPVVLDGALVSDGESLRAIDQMFEGLVTLKTGRPRSFPRSRRAGRPMRPARRGRSTCART